VSTGRSRRHLAFVLEIARRREICLKVWLKQVWTLVHIEFEQEYNARIPVIAAGGVFTGADAARFFKLGAQGVQMATRFVATHECSVPDTFKQMYLNADAEDVVIIKSPVGMPGRSIKTDLINQVISGKREPFKCSYRCLKTCDPQKVPYCIARALFNAVAGDINKAVVFCGSNVYRINQIVSVKELMDEIVSQANEALR